VVSLRNRFSPTPTNIKTPGLGYCYNLVMGGAGCQLITSLLIVFKALHQRLQLTNLVQKTDQIMLSHP
jgi:uncharacterized integral membrane protein